MFLESNRRSIREIDVQELAQLRDSDTPPPLIDVRTPDEFAEGHAPGAVNIPLQVVEARRNELEPFKDSEVYIICRSGARSATAVRALAPHGISGVNVAGGTLAWARAGYPLER